MVDPVVDPSFSEARQWRADGRKRNSALGHGCNRIKSSGTGKKRVAHATHSASSPFRFDSRGSLRLNYDVACYPRP